MILRIGRRSVRGRCLAASLLPQATSSSSPLQQTSMAATTTDSVAPPSFSRSLSFYLSRGFASQPAVIAADDSYDNQPGFDEDEEVTVNTWLQGKLIRIALSFDVVYVRISQPQPPCQKKMKTTAAVSSSPASSPSRSPSTRPSESLSAGTRAPGYRPRGSSRGPWRARACRRTRRRP